MEVSGKPLDKGPKLRRQLEKVEMDMLNVDDVTPSSLVATKARTVAQRKLRGL